MDIINRGFKPPFFHMIVGDESKVDGLIFKQMTLYKSNTIIRTIRGKKCNSVKGLFDEVSAALQFPYYFGENWAAFDECLNDLEWLPGESYILCFNHVDQILGDDIEKFAIFIKILSNTIEEWLKGRNFGALITPPTPFHIIFHCIHEKEDYVKNRLNEVGLMKIEWIEI